MVQMDRIRPDPRPINLRVSSSKYSTLRLLSRTSLEAARRAMPTSFGGGSSLNSIEASTRGVSIFAFYSPNVKPALQNDPGVPFAPRDPLAIEIFEQWNGILTRNAGPILELRDRERQAFLLLQKGAERL